MKALPMFVLLFTVPLIAVAQSDPQYRCTMGELIRRVAVEREGSAPVPCEVAYYKDTEAPGEREPLWNAANDTNYCAARASEFVAQLQGLGWQCVAAAATNATRDEDPAAR